MKLDRRKAHYVRGKLIALAGPLLIGFLNVVPAFAGSSSVTNLCIAPLIQDEQGAAQQTGVLSPAE